MGHAEVNEVEQGLEALLPRLWRFAVTLTRNPTAAEDLVQDTCVRAILKAEQFRQGTHLDRWCFAIMVNLWRSGHRKKVPEPADEEVWATFEAPGPSPEERAFSSQVLQAVDRLPEAQRIVVVMVYGEGLTYGEAADVAQIPIGTVMSRLHTARQKLSYLNQ